MPCPQRGICGRGDVALSYALQTDRIGLEHLPPWRRSLGVRPQKLRRVLVAYVPEDPSARGPSTASAACLPVAEALVGFCVLFSFQTKRALISGSVLMLVLTFGSTLRQNWPTVGILLMYSLVYSFLLAGVGVNYYSINRGVGLPLQRAQDYSPRQRVQPPK